MAKRGFKVPPVDGSLREVADGTRLAMGGKINCAGEVTLTASVASTDVTDARVSSQSVILLMPRTANAAAEVAAGGCYVSARDKGTFTITHANNAQTDRDFDYVIIA